MSNYRQTARNRTSLATVLLVVAFVAVLGWLVLDAVRSATEPVADVLGCTVERTGSTVATSPGCSR